MTQKNYLDLGYNVVSIEANPVWAKKVGKLFEKHIESGRLTITNVGISDKSNQSLTFYVPKIKKEVIGMVKWLDANGYLKLDQRDNSNLWNESAGIASRLEHLDEVSSMSKERTCAEKMFGCGREDSFCYCQEIPVKSTTCAELIKEYGTPHYLKVDIEGFDGYCMRSISTLPCSKMPKYISFEEQSVWLGSIAGSKELIQILSARGYKWKISRQKLSMHASIGTGPFGEDVEDFVHGKEWSSGLDAMERANADCWNTNVDDDSLVNAGRGNIDSFDCDVHGKMDISRCTELNLDH